MSDKTKAKGDAFAGSDASGVRVKQVFEDLKETLRETDPAKLSTLQDHEEKEETALISDHVIKDESPEVCHDNICDPTDIHIVHSHTPEHKVEPADEESIKPLGKYTGMPVVDALRQTQEADKNAGEEESLLSANFILEGHSYL
jgi:hypothetical protein